jgi:hypothetical protein
VVLLVFLTIPILPRREAQCFHAISFFQKKVTVNVQVLAPACKVSEVLALENFGKAHSFV